MSPARWVLEWVALHLLEGGTLRPEQTDAIDRLALRLRAAGYPPESAARITARQGASS